MKAALTCADLVDIAAEAAQVDRERVTVLALPYGDIVVTIPMACSVEQVALVHRAVVRVAPLDAIVTVTRSVEGAER